MFFCRIKKALSKKIIQKTVGRMADKSCIKKNSKDVGLIINENLNWVDHVKFRVNKAIERLF